MLRLLHRSIAAFIADESAPTMVEYALLVGFIALTAAAAAGALGSTLRETYESVLKYIPESGGSGGSSSDR